MSSSQKRGSRKPRAPKEPRVRWAHYTPQAAAGVKTGMEPRTVAADVQVSKLKLSPHQRSLIQELYNHGNIEDRVFETTQDGQLWASAVLAQYGLDDCARERIGSRWAQQWSESTKKATKNKQSTRRVLYQCNCGYDHTQTNTQNRHVPLPFTSCLSHVEVTYGGAGTRHVLRIRGHAEHNQECKDALFTRIPPVPIHPSVYHVALSQLSENATWADIQEKNQKLFKAKAYPDFPSDLGASPYRWLLEPKDSRSLYRQFNRMRGITVNEAPQDNVDQWLDPTSPDFNPTLANAIFHYKARAERGERFEVCIATEDMHEATWRYAHKSQIILDGTFGIANSRLLLFILMGVDEEWKGVPLAFLLFSAPTGNRQTSSGYDTKILTTLIGKWKDAVNSTGQKHGHQDEEFCPLVAITDSDLKERGALLSVFPRIWLLLCKYHLRQSWTNHRKREVKGTGEEHDYVWARLRRLEVALINTQSITHARDLLEAERKTLEELGSPAAEQAIRHVDYLRDYWTTDDLWKCWSEYGRTVAASALGCPVSSVLRTTNHLEAFNRVIKRKHLRRYQNNNRRLRVDILINLLVTKILPSIFSERLLLAAQNHRIAEQVRQLPGGAALLQSSRASTGTRSRPMIAYLIPDEQRDFRARELLSQSQLSAPKLLSDDSGFEFSCYSSLALDFERKATIYNIRVLFNGVSDCSCEDFVNKGGACKHIRAALLMLESLRIHWHARGVTMPHISIPSSISEAFTCQALYTASCVVANAEIPASQSPISRAAADIEDLLEHDDSCLESDVDDPAESSDVAADSDSDVDFDGDSDKSEQNSNHGEGEKSESDWTTLTTESNKNAFTEQALARALHVLDTISPNMGELASSLDGLTVPPSRLDQAGRIRGELALLLAKFDSMLLGEAHDRPRTPIATPTHSNVKRKLLPPSPEKLQKRKDSHSIH